jgi:multidrug resistance efflux pump
MKTTIRLVAAAAALIFVLHLVADRYTPYTSNARVKAIIVETVPQVSGYLAAVAVTNAQVVEAKQLLARIDQRPFALQLEKARADLQTATQEVGASSAQVAAAQASLAQAQAMLENTRPVQAIFELGTSLHLTCPKSDVALIHVMSLPQLQIAGEFDAMAPDIFH